jgi:nucleoside phosphorylase
MAGKRLKDWRAGIRSFQVESPTKQYLTITGSSAGQPQGSVAAGVRVPAAARGRCLWAGPSGTAALSSGLAGGQLGRSDWWR